VAGLKTSIDSDAALCRHSPFTQFKAGLPIDSNALKFFGSLQFEKFSTRLLRNTQWPLQEYIKYIRTVPGPLALGVKRAPQRAAGSFPCLGARIRALCAIEKSAVHNRI
jgi:hypothetical protein